MARLRVMVTYIQEGNVEKDIAPDEWEEFVKSDEYQQIIESISEDFLAILSEEGVESHIKTIEITLVP